jgi:FAD/FMN-containing dehydrogenase
MKSKFDQIQNAFRKLIEQLGADKVVAAGPEYEKSRDIWNAAVDYHPSIIVLCKSARDVQCAVSAAQSCSLSFSVRGGGHDWAGRSIRGEVVADLTRMRSVHIEGKVATVGGGVTSQELADAASAKNLTAVTGIIGSVGVAGLTLGGGYGHLTAKCGMALDNVLGAEVVLANGELIHTDATHEPDLFWAIRGGGGNFGVVTELRLKLYPIPDLSDGIIAFPWEQASEVFKAYNAMIKRAPDELTLMPTFFAAPDGKLSIVFHHAWCGTRSEDESMIETVRSFGIPNLVQVHRKTLAEVLTEAERRTMRGIFWIVRTVTLPELAPGAVEVIQRAMENRSSPLSWIASHPFYGAGERISLDSTAFGIRRRHFMVGIYTAWKPGNDAPHRAWADGVEAALQPYSLASYYPNYFGTDRPDQAAQAYGENVDRLLELKERYDPGHLFDAISLPHRRPFIGS